MQFRLIVPAAGSGSRLGGQSKQFRSLGDKSLLVQSIRPFVGHTLFGGVVVATSQGHIDSVAEMLSAEFGDALISVVQGGDTRQDSVRLALTALADDADCVVAIHDAVRPFVEPALISQLCETADRDGAACPAVPVSDTLRRVVDSVFDETVDRSQLCAVQTPQIFRARFIVEAHRRAAESALFATDDVELYQRFIGPVTFVEGSTRNFKITRSDDWEMAQLLWPSFAHFHYNER